MFSLLTDKLQDIFKDLRGHGKISETNITDALRAVRMALLEADVDFNVAKGFIARIKDRERQKAQLADRKSSAAQNRMKSIAALASEAPTKGQGKKRKAGEGALRESCTSRS